MSNERYTRVSNTTADVSQAPNLKLVKFNNFSVLNIENWYLLRNYDQRSNMFVFIELSHTSSVKSRTPF